jgi:hypothetical protein
MLAKGQRRIEDRVRRGSEQVDAAGGGRRTWPRMSFWHAAICTVSQLSKVKSYQEGHSSKVVKPNAWARSRCPL